MGMRRIGIAWQLNDTHGWGIFGLNLALSLIANGPTTPQLLQRPLLYKGKDETIAALAPFVEEFQKINTELEASDDILVFDDTTIIHSLSNTFTHQDISDRVRGRHNVGFVFFENGQLAASSLERAASWDRLLVGSSWNLEICRDAGIRDVAFVSQGIDENLFKPAPPSDESRPRFVIFSGGKLGLRKGQDLVLEAFRHFNQRHPDSLLITAWQNHWPQTCANLMESPYVSSLPSVDGQGKLNIVDWAAAHGVSASSFADAGWVPNAWMPGLLHQADLALFPNRCEGGTNLAAMEAMACGVPCILSANTGHLDLIREDNCYALQDQRPGDFSEDPGGHWRNSPVEEILEKMEYAYQNAEDRKLRGANAAAFMKQLSWRNQVAKIVTEIEDFL